MGRVDRKQLQVTGKYLSLREYRFFWGCIFRICRLDSEAQIPNQIDALQTESFDPSTRYLNLAKKEEAECLTQA